MQFGNLIKELRLINDLTQLEVANKIGISRSVLSQYENNLVEPTASVIEKLSKFFNVSADYLLGLSDDYSILTPAPMGGDVYSSEERKLIEQYRSIPEKLKKLVREQLEIYTAPSDLVSRTNKRV